MIELKNFSCFYGKREVVKGCSLSIRNGELTALLGPNGCGKSTLIKGLCQSVAVKGVCLVDGEKLSDDPKTLAKHLAYIPQRSGVNITLSVLDVVLMGANHRSSVFGDYNRHQRTEAVDVLQKFTDIPPDTDFLTLSEGQKQLVILARAFFQSAGNLLLDEPESALDFNNKHMILSKIQELAASGKCILVTLHDPSLALRYCDRLLFMKDGEIVGDAYTAGADPDKLEELFRKLYPDVQLVHSSGRLLLDRQ